MNHLDGLSSLRNRYLGLRHGQSEANVAGIVLSDPAVGVERYGLTPVGREQVRKSILARTDLDPSALICSSDFLRASETAEEARRALGAGPIRLVPSLRERFFGAWEGQDNSSYEQVWRQDAVDPTHTERDVESATAVLARTTAFVRQLEEAEDGQTIVLVSHGDALQILLTGFLGLDPASHRQREHWTPGEVRALTLRDAQGTATL